MSLRSLVTHKLRSFLTALGIIIGVASVISMISIGEGARRQTLNTISKFGTNIITIKPGQKKSRHVTTGKVDTLTLEDAEFIAENVSLITGVAAQVYRSAQLKFENKNTNSTVRGTGASYARLANFEIDRGRYFNKSEIRSAKRVCVVGSTVLKNLFVSTDVKLKIFSMFSISFSERILWNRMFFIILLLGQKGFVISFLKFNIICSGLLSLINHQLG